MSNDYQNFFYHTKSIASNLTTIENILAHEFFGNHMSDSAAFAMINQFIDNKNNARADRIAACKHICENGMGFDALSYDDYDAHIDNSNK